MKNNIQIEGIIHSDISLKRSEKRDQLSIHFVLENRIGNWKNYINCKAYGKLAETICKEFEKGDMVSITGQLKTGFYNETLKLSTSKFTYINIQEITEYE